MLESVTLHNFKAFVSQGILLRPLTLLTGLNGMGKSSALQSLLLLRQSFLQRVLTETEGSGLVLNGDLVQLGTGSDVLFDNADADEIGITLKSNGQEARWRFGYDRQADVLRLMAESVVPNSIFTSNLFSNDFHFLEAERVGPRTSFEMADFVVREQKQIGTKGQFTAHFLDQYRSTEVSDALHHPFGRSSTLIHQVTAWMGDISPGAVIRVEGYGEMDLMRLAFGFERADTAGDIRYYRSTNVGFGLTYTLPVLVALLSSPAGALVLLENPEAHLHPRGQSYVGELIARVANVGVQVIVETHSDHILNGIRIAVKNSLMSPTDVALHFFERPVDDSESSGVTVVSPQIDSDGRLDFWPEGFFDEYGKSLQNLL
ncbi:MAG: DUF3696 domain-containing protein [Candidatus Poribacteria bacterium]|nr:DUF3696 domain-containing protein [Candidatus Poribacteria bacterium]